MMGLLGDLNKLRKQAKEMEATWDPGAQARDSLERLKAMNAQMEAATQAIADGVPATGQIVSVGPTTGMMNMDPILPIELLVQRDGAPPRPLTTALVVPMAQLYRVQPGAVLPLRVSTSNPNSIAVDWSAPAEGH